MDNSYFNNLGREIETEFTIVNGPPSKMEDDTRDIRLKYNPEEEKNKIKRYEERRIVYTAALRALHERTNDVLRLTEYHEGEDSRDYKMLDWISQRTNGLLTALENKKLEDIRDRELMDEVCKRVRGLTRYGHDIPSYVQNKLQQYIFNGPEAEKATDQLRLFEYFTRHAVHWNEEHLQELYGTKKNVAQKTIEKIVPKNIPIENKRKKQNIMNRLVKTLKTYAPF